MLKMFNFYYWVKVSENEVIWSWLNAEFKYKNHQFKKFYDSYKNQIENKGRNLILDNPDFNDEQQNMDRKYVFNNVRGNYYLWKPIKDKTTWYKITILIHPFMSKRIVGPYPPKNKNTFKTNLNNIILWGHEKKGPFIILEGNHRWYARNKWKPYLCNIYVGLSNYEYELFSETFKDIV